MKNRYNELIKELTDRELLFHLYATQILLLTISFILGIILYDHFSFINNIKWQDPSVIWAGAGSGVAVVMVDIILMKLLPPAYYDDGGLNEKLFRKRSFLHIAFLTALVAFSEELLFRGVIQTKTGLIMASLIFAIIHYRYLFNWFLFINIVSLSFFIGFIYDWTGNLAVTIIMHFIIDFLLGVYIKVKPHKKKEQEGLQNE